MAVMLRAPEPDIGNHTSAVVDAAARDGIDTNSASVAAPNARSRLA
jgi:hypothetical protein